MKKQKHWAELYCGYNEKEPCVPVSELKKAIKQLIQECLEFDQHEWDADDSAETLLELERRLGLSEKQEESQDEKDLRKQLEVWDLKEKVEKQKPVDCEVRLSRFCADGRQYKKKQKVARK